MSDNKSRATYGKKRFPVLFTIVMSNDTSYPDDKTNTLLENGQTASFQSLPCCSDYNVGIKGDKKQLQTNLHQ
ncbi:hypothetical protein HanHA300_Chr03g0091951 [Helianthus annuus]|nr:hypothetical protein HanHA300_Chr03g0091951 [Helianthus annuus]KAJ0768060.1 hypothetical protein HanLR1_Chr03g0097071 [Helianthus annuus]